MPEACRPELEGALQELSQAIAALRADRGDPPADGPDPPEPGRRPWPARPSRHVFSAIPDLLTVIDRDFNIMSNWHESDMVPDDGSPAAAGPSATGFTITGTAPARTAMSWRSSPPVNPKDRKDQSRGRPGPGIQLSPSWMNPAGWSWWRSTCGTSPTRHLAEQALKESEGRFRTLIEDSPESLFLTDVQGTILAASRVAARRVGKNCQKRLSGPHLLSIFPPEVASRRRALFEQAVATGRPVRFEDVRDDMHFDINFNPILDADGKVSRLSILAIDITDRKNAEQALKEKTRLNQILLDAFPCVALLLRPGTREIVAANAEAVKAGAVPGTQCFSHLGAASGPLSMVSGPGRVGYRGSAAFGSRGPGNRLGSPLDSRGGRSVYAFRL